ncbi:hypothetical protein BC831DRAFT_465326 [Entophlyctis helioformis]|nr:hypothetical protein BC831DRAFT_465326 [Entophlyctis helioformis]
MAPQLRSLRRTPAPSWRLAMQLHALTAHVHTTALVPSDIKSASLLVQSASSLPITHRSTAISSSVQCQGQLHLRSFSSAAAIQQQQLQVRIQPAPQPLASGPEPEAASLPKHSSAPPHSPGDHRKPPLSEQQVAIPELFPRLTMIDLPRLKMAAAKPSLSQLETLTTARALSRAKVEERIALVYASLQIGDLERAETIFNRCWRTNPVEVKNAMNTDFVNDFIDAHFARQRIATNPDGSLATSLLARGESQPPTQSFNNPLHAHVGHEQRAFDWLRRLGEFSLSPNDHTFAILVKYHLHVGATERVKELIAEFEQQGFSVAQLLDNPRFLDREDRRPLEALLRSINKISAPSAHAAAQTMIDDLLLSALDDVKSQASASSGHHAQEADLRAESGSSGLLPKDTVSDSAGLSNLQSPSNAQPHTTSVDPRGPPTASPESAPSSQSHHDAQLEAIRRERTQTLVSTGATGVKILRNTLATMNQVGGMEKYNQQLWLEERSYAAALEQHEESLKSLPPNLRRLAQLPTELMRKWHRDLRPLIQQELDSLKKETVDPEKNLYGPFLQLLTAEQLSRITISEFLKSPTNYQHQDRDLSRTGCTKAIRIAMNIANTVEHEHNIQQLKSKPNQRLLKMEHGIHHLHTTGKLFNLTVRKVASEMTKKETKLNSRWKPDWGEIVKVKIGTVLAELFIRVATISVQVPDPDNPGKTKPVDVPAFEHRLESRNNKLLGVFAAHHALLDLLSNGPIHVSPIYLPMLVKPRPWLTASSGGYLQHRSDLVRIHSNHEHSDYLKAADEANHLSLVLRALDVLGSTPWTINQPVYRVAASLWNSGVDAPCMPKLDRPPEIPKPADHDTNPAAKRRYFIETQKRQRAMGNNYSQRCDVNYKLEIAKSFLGETIYFPHNVDFRGRAYPMPPHLNHIGNDLCRGLMSFKEKRPLGERGLRWLKIQVANLAGFDKASLDEREAFAEKHRADVIDSAENPLKGNMWWIKGDSPWQLLATCIELNEAFKCEDPAKFMSSLPIHQDGSCNGLQHYAALGGDVAGARVVNLVPAERPQDVYMGVAKQVQLLVDADAKLGVTEAVLMKNRINRKLVKQTVMTNTYGVTFIGARAQVKNRLKEARASEDPLTALTDDQIVACSLYITKKIFDSMGTIFEGARSIQIWLNQSARTVAKSIPEEDISPEQLKDSAQLAKMGLLPSSQSVLSMEHEESLRDVEGPAPSASSASAVASSLSQTPDALHSASLLESAAESDATFAAQSGLTEAQDAHDGEDFLSLDEEWNRGLAEKAPIRIKSSKNGIPAKMTSVIWTTPLGLPVVQPYRNSVSNDVKTNLQTFTVVDLNEPAPVNPQKQSTAFPPNFVHSLDASHMMLSAIACQARNIEFAAVHDSYWTHASTVDEMNSILREAFVRLHSENIMERLRNELLARYQTHKLMVRVPIKEKQHVEQWNKYLVSEGRAPVKRSTTVIAWVDLALSDLPVRGEFDVRQVINSQYFFH